MYYVLITFFTATLFRTIEIGSVSDIDLMKEVADSGKVGSSTFSQCV